MEISKKTKIWIGGIALLLLPLYFFLDPEKGSLFPKCPFLSLTGLYCPGCGSQRAIHDLLHLKVFSSLDHNLLVIPALLLLGVHAWQLFRRKEIEKDGRKLLFHKAITPILLGVLFTSFGVLRNLPIEFLDFLKP